MIGFGALWWSADSEICMDKGLRLDWVRTVVLAWGEGDRDMTWSDLNSEAIFSLDHPLRAKTRTTP